MNPDRKVEVFPGEWRPECFGRHGYGDGYKFAGTCHIRICPSSDQCYESLRKAAEERDPEAHAEYMAKRKLLREEGLDGQTISFVLSAQGFPPTTQEGYLANYRAGQLASNLWRECQSDGCSKLIAKSHDTVYCREHEEPHAEVGPGPAQPDDDNGEPGPRARRAQSRSRGDTAGPAVQP